MDDSWKFANHHFGITTYYRREDDGSLSLKLDGDITGIPLFEQLAVFRDVDLHHKWVPFCTSSMTIAELDKLDLVGWFMTGVPALGLARDGCFRVIGCDNMSVDDTVIVTGQGIQDRKPHHQPPADTYLEDDAIISQLRIPPVPSKRGNDRMTIRNFEAVIQITSPTSCTTRLVANIDPNIPFLSQSIIDFCMKHLAGVMLSKMQQAAKKILKNPVSNPHAIRMRQDAAFYQTWLLTKFKAICHEKGWDLPSVAAFSVTEEQLLQNHHHLERVARRRNTFSGEDEENDVPAVSNHSTPNLKPQNSDDSVSALSSTTFTSIWSNNLVAQRMRQRKYQQERLKNLRVAESRKGLANLIRPKELLAKDQERLDGLKEAKRRKDMPVSSFWQRIVTSFYHHGLVTQFMVMATLTTLLFVALHPQLVVKDVVVEKKLDSSSECSFGVQVVWDCGTALYILLCAVLHLLTCDIALMYAFVSLDLGHRAGGQVKSYYRQSVHAGAAVSSLGIMVFSIVKGIVNVYLRKSLWYSFQYYLRMTDWSPMDFLPPMIVGPLKSGVGPIGTAFKFVATCISQLVLSPAKLARTFFLQSLVGSLFSSMLGGVAAAVHTWATVNSTGELKGHGIWRHDAFTTAKIVYSYTAIFLLITLVLFNIFAKRTRSDEAKGHVGQALGLPEPNKSLSSEAGALTSIISPESRPPDQTTRDRLQKESGSDLSSASSGRRRGMLQRFRRKDGSDSAKFALHQSKTL
jgi:hypothetical protein